MKGGTIIPQSLSGHKFSFTPFNIEQICSKQTVKINLKRKYNNAEQIKKIPKINNPEHCQWPGAWYSFLTSIYLICPHLHMAVVLSLRGRECGKALTLPLKLVMETCSWGQRMDWAWQPITSRKSFSGGAKAARCDPMRLSAGGKAPGWWSKRLPLASVKTPPCRPTLSIQETTLKPGLCHYEGMKNRDLRLRLFLGQLTGLLMPPWSLLPLPAPCYIGRSARGDSRVYRKRLKQERFWGVHLYCWSPLNETLGNKFVICLTGVRVNWG